MARRNRNRNGNNNIKSNFRDYFAIGILVLGLLAALYFSTSGRDILSGKKQEITLPEEDMTPTTAPTPTPTPKPTPTPTPKPTPTQAPSDAPAATDAPSAEPTATAAPTPTAEPNPTPTPSPTPTPRPTSSPIPTAIPTAEPTAEPTPEPTQAPTATPTVEPTDAPTAEPTPEPTADPNAPVIAERQAAPDSLGAYADENILAGLETLGLSAEGDDTYLVVTGWAYNEFRSAAPDEVYLILNDAAGQPFALFETQRAPSEAMDDVPAEAHFRAIIDAASLPDGAWYLTAALRENGAYKWQYLNDSVVHFTVSGGQITLL